MKRSFLLFKAPRDLIFSFKVTLSKREQLAVAGAATQQNMAGIIIQSRVTATENALPAGRGSRGRRSERCERSAPGFQMLKIVILADGNLQNVACDRYIKEQLWRGSALSWLPRGPAAPSSFFADDSCVYLQLRFLVIQSHLLFKCCR